MIQIAVVGAGHWGPNLIRNFHTSAESRVRYVVDRSSSRLDSLRSRFPDIEMLSSLDPVLADSKIDAVVVSTPTTTHFEICRRALEAGKHVLVEKPIAASLEDSQRLVELAKKHDRILMVGHVFLYNTAVQRVKQVLDAGTLGRVFYISMVRTNLGPIRLDVNAAWDLAAHDISIVNYWLGASAKSASAVGGDYINKGVADVVFATLRYPNDVLVNLHASWLNPRKSRDITLVGDRKMLTFDDMNLQEPIRVYDKGVKDEPVGGGAGSAVVDTFASFRASVREGDITIPKVAMGEPLKSECDHFLQCLTQKKQPLSDGQTGVEVVKALQAIQRSLAHGGREESAS